MTTPNDDKPPMLRLTQSQSDLDALKCGVEAMASYVPPSSIVAEQSVLGAMLLQSKCIEDVDGLIDTDDFYRDAHQLVYKAIRSLVRKSQPVDCLTVKDVLDRGKKLEAVGGVGYLFALMDSVPTAANVAHYAGIVSRTACRRRIIDGALSVIGLARGENSDDINALIDASHRLIDKGVPRSQQDECWESVGRIAMRVMEKAEDWQLNPGIASGIPTGFAMLDRVTAGLQLGEVTIIGARPSIGKSALAIQIAAHASITLDLPAAVIPTEMTPDSVVMRVLCEATGVDSLKMRRGELTEDQFSRLHRYYEKIFDAPFFFYNGFDMNLKNLTARIKRKIRQDKLKIIVIDHMGHVEGDKTENRTQEMTEISRALLNIARTENVAVIEAVQLSRTCETRPDKRPLLSDLRDCGSLEQDAHNVWMLYREDYYAETKLPAHVSQKAELIIRKARSASTTTVRLGFIPELTRFENVMPDMEGF